LKSAHMPDAMRLINASFFVLTVCGDSTPSAHKNKRDREREGEMKREKETERGMQKERERQ